MRCSIARFGLAAIVALATVVASRAVGSEPLTISVSPSQNQNKSMTIEQTPFGKTKDSKDASLFTMKNAAGTVVKMTDYGATVVSVETKDKSGKLANINCGFDSLAGYENHGSHFGATVGRYANRIAKGKFTLDGKEYTLPINNGANHLHGGEGFDRRMWTASTFVNDDGVGVKFSITSPDGDQGYPGEMKATATYTLTKNNELKIDYTATTSKPTVVNLTNHNYWNMGGVGSGTVLNHEMMIAADKYVDVGPGLIPNGKLPEVKGTALDFTKPTKIGSRIDEPKKNKDANGYDHCYVLRGQDGKLALAAKVKDPASGRVMEVFTTEPGIQLYTANHFDGSANCGGSPQHGACCLETQHYPDSPNQPSFPSTVLKPGETFKSTTVHKFSVES
jgi:aldose 1-epimerase